MDQLKRPHKFAIIPEWVLDRVKSGRAIQLYAVLWLYSSREDRIAFPSLSTLAERMGVSRGTVVTALGELVEAGAVKVDKQQRADRSMSRNIYTMHAEPRENQGSQHAEHQFDGQHAESGGQYTESGGQYTDPNKNQGNKNHSTKKGECEGETKNPNPETPEPDPPLSASTAAGTTTPRPKRRAKTRTKKKSGGWTCRHCGHTELLWIGRCPQCGEWGAMEEVQGEAQVKPGVRWRQPTRNGPPPLRKPPKPETAAEKRLVEGFPGRCDRPRIAVRAFREEEITEQEVENILRWASVRKESKQWRDGYGPDLHNVILERLWENGDEGKDGGEPAWRREQRNYFPG